jgi:hypothetical protein
MVLYDVTGREIVTVLDEDQIHNSHQVALDGNRLATGVYVYKLTAKHQQGVYSAARKLLVIK